MKTVYGSIGSISHATLRPEDLIPAYVAELDRLKEELVALNSPETVERVGKIDTLLGEIEKRQEQEGYYDSEDASHDMEELTEWLETFAPPFAYFGCTEGDGSDIGFWVSEDSLREAEYEEELVRCDELPEQYDPAKMYLQVSDHGNPTLYGYDEEKGGLEEIW